MDPRIYTVRDEDAPDALPRLVRATHPTHARRHVLRRPLVVEIASQEDLVAAISAGVKVEDAGQQQEPAAAPPMPPADLLNL